MKDTGTQYGLDRHTVHIRLRTIYFSAFSSQTFAVLLCIFEEMQKVYDRMWSLYWKMSALKIMNYYWSDCIADREDLHEIP